MQLTKEPRPSHTITVITKKRRGVNSPARTTSHSIESRQPAILGLGYRSIRDELRIFKDE
jgi:hypothetical protein